MHKPKNPHRHMTWYVGLVLKWYQSRKKQGGEGVMHINLGRFIRYFLVIYGLQKVQSVSRFNEYHLKKSWRY